MDGEILNERFQTKTFRTFGLAIKNARTKMEMTLDHVGGIIHINPRYLTNIEKESTPRLTSFL